MRDQIDEILSFLFLSNERCSANVHYLQSLKIQAIFNGIFFIYFISFNTISFLILFLFSKVTKEARNYHPNTFEYFRLPVEDASDTNLLEHFDLVVDKIEEARLQNKNVLVHCVMGMSRFVLFIYLNI